MLVIDKIVYQLSNMHKRSQLKNIFYSSSTSKPKSELEAESDLPLSSEPLHLL